MKRRNSHWTIIWIFHIKPTKDRTFRRVYGPRGDWAKLFAKDPNYIATELLRNAASTNCYVTVDRWASRTAYHNFKKRHRNEFAALDARCEALTVRESKIGEFASVDNAFVFSWKRRGAKSSARRRDKRPS
jgi:heme-degrading monooxygenase HmoA